MLVRGWWNVRSAEAVKRDRHGLCSPAFGKKRGDRSWPNRGVQENAISQYLSPYAPQSPYSSPVDPPAGEQP